MARPDQLEPETLDRSPVGFDDGLRACELLLQDGLDPLEQRAVDPAGAVDQPLVDAGRPGSEHAVHAEMPVEDDCEARRPVEVGRDAVAVMTDEDLLRGHPAHVDGDVVEVELLAVIRQVSAFEHGAAEDLTLQRRGRPALDGDSPDLACARGDRDDGMAEFMDRQRPAELLRERHATRKTAHDVRDGDRPSVAAGDAAGQPDDPGDVRACQAEAVLGELGEVLVRKVAGQVVAKDSDTCLGIRQRKTHMVVQATRTEDCWIDDGRVVAGPDDHYAFPVDRAV